VVEEAEPLIELFCLIYCFLIWTTPLWLKSHVSAAITSNLFLLIHVNLTGD